MKAVILLSSLAFLLPTQSLIGQILSIKEARVLAPRTQVSVIGTVTTFNFSTVGTQFFMQDETAGINVFSSSPVRFVNDTLSALTPRKSIYVSGEISLYNGLIEIIPSIMEVIRHDVGFLPDPIWVEGTSVEVIQTGIYPMGDVSMNGQVRAHYAGLILKYLAGYMEMNEAQMILCNVSGDEEVSAYDASLILQYVVGKIYELPHREPPLKVSGMATMKRNMEMADELVTVPISLQTEQDVYAFSATVTFDTEFLTYKGYTLPEKLSDFTVQVNTIDGVIKIIGATSTGVVLKADELRLEFEKVTELPTEGTHVVLSSLRLNEEETILSVDSSIITPIVSGLADQGEMPSTYLLYQNFPNPFNPSTTLRYDLPESGEVSLAVFDVTGRRVAVLVSAVQPAGAHQVLFNAVGLPSGLYFYELKTKEYSKVHKMMLIK